MLRVIVRCEDAAKAANVGGNVDTDYHTVDIDAPEVEKLLRAAKVSQYTAAQVVGVELLPQTPDDEARRMENEQ